MANYTPEQALQLNIKAMGEALGRLHYTLTNEHVWLHAKWQQYVVLFGTSSSRVDLINQAAGLFFKVIQDSLWEDTLLHIARLTDPPQSGRGSKKKNLTIRCLDNTELIRDHKLQETIKLLLKVATDKSEFARDWRNRRIAHRDFSLAMEEETKPLEPASQEKVQEALRSISNVLNAISGYYKDSEMHFGAPTHFKGATALLGVIDLGLRAEQERRNRIKSGKPAPEDFKRRIL